jgi:hypothetical protein
VLLRLGLRGHHPHPPTPSPASGRGGERIINSVAPASGRGGGSARAGSGTRTSRSGGRVRLALGRAIWVQVGHTHLGGIFTFIFLAPLSKRISKSLCYLNRPYISLLGISREELK